MRRLIFLTFIGTFLTTDVTLSKVHVKSPSNLEWLFGSGKLSDNEEEKRTICESEECKKMANLILGGMNRSVNPCDDFYEYACGKWPEQNPIPKGLNQWNMMYKLQIKIFNQVQEIIKAEPTKDDLKPVKLAKKWFQACMDTDEIEKQGTEPLVSTLLRLGGWPMIMEPGKWDEQEYSWQKVDDQYMHLTGRNVFYDVRVKKDDSKVVEIDTPHLPPGSKQLRSMIESDSEEEYDEEDGKSKSDEDPSDEEQQSEEKPGSEGEDDSKIDYNDGSGNSDDDDDDDGTCNCDDDDDGSGNSDDDDNDDDDGSGNSDDDDDDGSGNSDDDDDGSGNNDDDYGDYYDDDDDTSTGQDEDIKKEISKKKIGKVEHRNKKLRHVRQRKSDTWIMKKHDSHKMKKQRIKRWSIVEVANKRAQRFNRREKLHTRRGKRNQVKKIHGKRTKKILSNGDIYTTAIPQVSTEETNKDNKNEMTLLLQQYTDYISKVARILAKDTGIEISQERLDKDIQDMIKFQMKLIQILPNLDSTSNLKVTLGGLQEWYNKKNPKTIKSKINWVNKIKALFDETDESVNEDLDLVIISPSYIKNLIYLLDETSNETIVNYIHWNFISRIIKTSTREMTALYESWEKASKGQNSKQRWYNCAQSADIKDILAYEFVRKYFSDDIMKTTLNMISDIQKEVEYLIKESDWFDDEAKNFALAKVKNFKKFIGYPNWYKNTTIIEEYYKGLVIDSSYYKNVLRYNRYIKWKNLRKLSKNNGETDKEESLDPVIVNAFYMPLRNALVFPAADFQSSWFSYDRPRFVNFGIIGFIIAHEVNHGFDDTGHLYDKNGKFLGWFSSMADAYDKKEDCFVEQFNNYPIDKNANKKIKNYGKQTTSDNIADTMGLQTIFKVYQRKEKESKTPDTTLPGMEDFTKDQQFFLSFANLWCEAVNPEKLMELAKNDDHSIGRLRIIGSVSNSDDFARAFNCPVGSPMNPKKKCNIWK